MSSLLGLGDAPSAAAVGADGLSLSLEDVLSLLADCDAGRWASASASAAAAGNSEPALLDLDLGGSLQLPWPATPPSSDDAPMEDALAQFDESFAEFVAQGDPLAVEANDNSPELLHVEVSPVAAPEAGAVAPSGAATGAKKKKKKPGYNSNKARDQRKEELLYLRKKVDQMESYLRKLRETAARNDGAGTTKTLARRMPSTTDASAFKVAEVGPVWEDIAARQYKERRRAEMENIRLKLVLEGQIKVAKTLEKVLNKRYNDRVLESIRGKQKLKRVDRPIDPDDDAPIFRELLSGIENALNEVDRDFEANGLARMVKPYHDAQLRRDGLDGSVVMEIFANKMMPFDVTSTGNAVWNHFAHSMERVPARSIYEKQLKNVIAATEDMVVESFGLELAGSHNNKADLHVRQILRKFVEQDRVVIAWRVVAEPIEVSTERTDGIRLLEKGYTVIKKARSDVDTHSLVQTCYIIRPEIYGTIADQERKVGAVTDFLLESVARTISSSHQMIENVLLDQALRVGS